MTTNDAILLQVAKQIRISQLEKAKNDFWEYCKLRAPDFYTDARPHLKRICSCLQSVYQGTAIQGRVYKKLMVNIPPQMGKTRTLVLFCQWILGCNQQERIIAASYNDTTAIDFSKYTRNGIMERRQKLGQVIFQDIYPGVYIKHGEMSQQKWSLQGQHFSYIGTGIGGSVTSKGGTVLIVDDPVKGAVEALNKMHLDKLWLWYTGTFLSRVSAEGGQALQIIVHTRWSEDDISGRLLKDEADEWYVITMEAYDQKTGKMLCEDLLNHEEYERRKRIMLMDNITAMIFWANYHQRLIDVGDKLYKPFKTYAGLPDKHNGSPVTVEMLAYADVADQGQDYLCLICYAMIKGLAYITDVFYTDEPAEITEPLAAKMLTEQKVNLAVFESNSGGKYFARNVREGCRRLKNGRTVVRWTHQNSNKIARIHANSHWLVTNVLMPYDWANRWPEFYLAITTYQRKAKNKHDDAPDALTGIAEHQTEGRILKAAVIG